MNKGWPWLMTPKDFIEFRKKGQRKRERIQSLRTDKQKRAIRKQRKTGQYCETSGSLSYLQKRNALCRALGSDSKKECF